MDSPAATLDAWRERGADRVDPVRFRFMEALARRAAVHEGPVRRILDDRLAELVASYRDDLETARRDGSDGTSAVPSARTALAELVDHIGRHAPNGDGRAELKALRHFRSTWSRLSAQQRLKQSLAQLPPNAGPLNSHHLVHRSLTLMRDLSPGYLDRFMSYVDALLWLDVTPPPRVDAGRKGGLSQRTS